LFRGLVGSEMCIRDRDRGMFVEPKKYEPAAVPEVKEVEKELVEEIKPATKELQEEASKKLVFSEEQTQPMLMVIGLVGFAIALSAFAAGSSIRMRRRR
jgi:hypothetical protein